MSADVAAALTQAPTCTRIFETGRMAPMLYHGSSQLGLPCSMRPAWPARSPTSNASSSSIGCDYVAQTVPATSSSSPPDLAAILEATPRTNLTFLTTAAGAPFTANSFGNLFREWCIEADLPAGLASHGLRKACCRRLAEAGCAANVIAAISGHTTLRMVEKYTKAADQKKMAVKAMVALTAAFPSKRGT